MDYLYSNLGYVIVAAMAVEKVSSRTWEDSDYRHRCSKPLGMDSAGFGGTGTLWEN